MASQSVLKLKVDDKEYSAGLKNAQQGLQALRQSLEQQGRTFNDVGKNVVDYVREIGNMESTAKNSRGVLRDMSQTLTDLTLQYRELSDAEKSSPFGQALAASIEELTNRAGDISDAMGDVQASITNMASDTRTFDQLAQGASVATSAFQVMQGAGKLLGVEMGDNVEVLARLQAAMSITTGLTTIQNAVQKQSALMQGIMAVQAKAAAAAQALLAANTGKATVAQKLFNTVAKANPYMLLVSGITAVVGVLGLFGSSSDEATEKTNTLKNAIDNLNASMDFNIQLSEKMGASSEQVAGMRIEAAKSELQMAQQRKEQIGQVYRAIGKDATKNPEYMAAVDAEIDAAKRLAAAERDLAQIRVTRIRLMNTWDKGETDKEIRARINALREELDVTKRGTKAYTDLTNKITQLEGQLKSTSPTPKPIRTKTTHADEPTAAAYSIAGLTAQMQALRKEQEQVTSTSAWEEYQRRIFGVTDAMKMLRGELSPQGLGAVSFSDVGRKAVEANQQSLKDKKLELKLIEPPEDKKKDIEASEVLGSISSAVGNMVSGIEGLGIEIPKDMQNMLGALNSITMILTSIEAFQKVGALLGIFSHGGVVKAASGYTVPGRNFSGDMIPARLNAGELVLNQAQAGVIASALQDRDFSGGMGGQPYTNGENIILGINNTYKRKGMGEIVTTSMLRRMGLMN